MKNRNVFTTATFVDAKRGHIDSQRQQKKKISDLGRHSSWFFFFFHSDFEITDFREQMEHTINLSSWKADIVRNEADEIALFS